jgi:hypothetical protein
MTAHRPVHDSCPTDEASSHDRHRNGVVLRLLPAHEARRAEVHASDETALKETDYLALALASRRAAGLPDEITEYEPWRAFSRAINREDPPLATPRTFGADRRSGFPYAQHPSAPAAEPVTGSEAPPAANPQGRPPT